MGPHTTFDINISRIHNSIMITEVYSIYYSVLFIDEMERVHSPPRKDQTCFLIQQLSQRQLGLTAAK